jgi:serine/threonine protein phosphatase 1
MWDRLTKRSRAARLAPPQVPAGSRVYAIGDVHGCAALLRGLHRRILDDAAAHPTPRKIVIYLGDFVDRGEESRAVIDLLIDEPLPGFERVLLRGNHEDSMLRFLVDAAIGPSWLAYGGDATLLSYGVRPPKPIGEPSELERAQSELAERLPERHRRFLAGLRLSHVEGDFFFVHAGVRPGVPLDRQDPADLLWIRDEFLRSEAAFGKIVVHGHSITARPDLHPNRIGIDTGAFASGCLTCLILEGAALSFIQT